MMTKTTAPATGLPEDDPSALEAGSWLLRMEKGLSPEEDALFAEWLVQDPRHEQIFQEIRQTSEALAKLSVKGQATESIGKRHLHWTGLAALGGLAAALVAAVSLYLQRQEPEPLVQADVITVLGESRVLALADGSQITVNTDSAVSVRYTAGERRIALLRGEAYFKVAKNPSWPFWVVVDGLGVRAVGTEFDVRCDTSGVQVLVSEGKVRILESGSASPVDDRSGTDIAPVLVVGDVARVTGKAVSGRKVDVARLPQLQTDNALAWRKGRIEFSNQPLSEVIAEFNRYNSHKIVIDDPALAARIVGGGFGAHNIQPFLDVLEHDFDVVAVESADRTVIHYAR